MAVIFRMKAVMLIIMTKRYQKVSDDKDNNMGNDDNDNDDFSIK